MAGKGISNQNLLIIPFLPINDLQQQNTSINVTFAAAL
jgi:hypothetical protein